MSKTMTGNQAFSKKDSFLKSAGQTVLGWLTGPVVLSVVLAFVIGGIFIAITGVNPFAGYASMLTGSFGSGIGIANTLVRAIPLVGMALAISIGFRAGIINLGGEGQMILGGLAAGVVALYMPGPGPVVVLCALLAGVIVGAVLALLPALFYMWPGVPILLTSLLLNYPARFFASWVTRFPLKDPDSSMVASKPFPDGRVIPLLASPSSPTGQFLVDTFGKDSFLTVVGRTVNWSLLIITVVVILISYMNRRTVFGFESGISGLNFRFASYGGVRTTRMTVQTMLLSGGLAGLVGAMLTVGAPSNRVIEGTLFTTNYAWIGLLVALLALYKPSGVVIAGVFFAGIIAGAGALGRDMGMSPQIASVIQGIAIVLIAFRVEWPKGMFKGRRNMILQSPGSRTEPPDDLPEMLDSENLTVAAVEQANAASTTDHSGDLLASERNEREA